MAIFLEFWNKLRSVSIFWDVFLNEQLMVTLLRGHVNQMRDLIQWDPTNLDFVIFLHCQSPHPQFLVYQYLHVHFHRDHHCQSKNRGRCNSSLIYGSGVDCLFVSQLHLTNRKISSGVGASFVITRIHLSCLFSH